MYKLLLSIILICCTTLVGNWFAVRLSSRRRTLSAIIESIRKMKTLICFGGYEVHRVIAEGFDGVKGFDVFCSPCEDDTDFLTWWNLSVDSLSSELALDKEDKQMLKRFSEGLGVSDIEGQISNCELYTELFSERLKESKETENNRSRLYRILGFSLGCTVTLLVL